MLAARRAERLERIAKEISQEGGVALPLATDLCDPTARVRLVRRSVEEFGGIDLLVNNAGWTTRVDHADHEALTDEILFKTFEVNVYGTW